ncbi:hypothetical protein GCK32_022321, partial [Trichostrongylus colubriformis]
MLKLCLLHIVPKKRDLGSVAFLATPSMFQFKRSQHFFAILIFPASSFEIGSIIKPVAINLSLKEENQTLVKALDYRIMISVSYMAASVIAVIVAFIFSWQLGLLGAALSCSLLMLIVLNMRITYKCHEKKKKEDRSSE